MYPVLFHIGSLAIRTYGVLLAFSFLAGIWLARKRAERTIITSDQILDLSLYLIISSVLGARLLYVVLHWGEFSDNLFLIVNPFQSPGEFGVSGLVFYGGLLSGTLTGIWFAFRNDLPFRVLADVMTPSIALGLAISRIGCFLNACCFGLPCEQPWGVRFPIDSVAGNLFHGPIHPTQIYSSVGAAFIFGIVWLIDRHRPFDGFSFCVFLALYGVLRFTVDFFRFYDAESIVRIFDIPFSVNQLISLGFFIAAWVAYVKWGKMKNEK